MGGLLHPIYSPRADDPALSESLDRFVLTLTERVDDLQDAHSAGDASRLSQLALALATEAEPLGYAPLSRLAEVLASAAAEDKMEEARGHVIELTDLSQRIRMGHRGAI